MKIYQCICPRCEVDLKPPPVGVPGPPHLGDMERQGPLRDPTNNQSHGKDPCWFMGGVGRNSDIHYMGM